MDISTLVLDRVSAVLAVEVHVPSSLGVDRGEVKAGIQPFTASFPRSVGTLIAAGIFRDCSFRVRATVAERRACRILMRGAAIRWRGGLVMGD